MIILNMFIHTSMDKSCEEYQTKSRKNISLVINTNVGLNYLSPRISAVSKGSGRNYFHFIGFSEGIL